MGGGGLKVCNESNEEREESSMRVGCLHEVILPALKAILNEHYSSPWRNPVTSDTKVDMFGKSAVTSHWCCGQNLCLLVPKPSSYLKTLLSFDKTVHAASGPPRG